MLQLHKGLSNPQSTLGSLPLLEGGTATGQFRWGASKGGQKFGLLLLDNICSHTDLGTNITRYYTLNAHDTAGALSETLFRARADQASQELDATAGALGETLSRAEVDRALKESDGCSKDTSWNYFDPSLGFNQIVRDSHTPGTLYKSIFPTEIGAGQTLGFLIGRPEWRTPVSVVLRASPENAESFVNALRSNPYLIGADISTILVDSRCLRDIELGSRPVSCSQYMTRVSTEAGYHFQPWGYNPS